MQNQFCDTRHFRVADRIQIAMSTFGGTSIVACICVIAVILAFKKDKKFLRERIILGLMIANIMFSIGSAVPSWYVDLTSCEHLISVRNDDWQRALWFSGKYVMVCYEILIVTVSIYALRTGLSTVPAQVELLAHSMCCFIGVGVFAAWIFESQPLISEFVRLQQPFSSYYLQHAQGNLTASEIAHLLQLRQQFVASSEPLNTKYEALSMLFLRIWLVPLGLSLILWRVSRHLYTRILQGWEEQYGDTVIGWPGDDDFGSDTSVLTVQQRVWELRRNAYTEIVEPLDPYVVIFVVFTIPVLVMSTDYCIRGDDRLCQPSCELALSLRSLATASVYFWDRTNRKQLFQWGKLLKKLRDRCFCCCASHSIDDAVLHEQCKPNRTRLFARGKAVHFSADLKVILINELDDDDVENCVPPSSVLEG